MRLKTFTLLALLLGVSMAFTAPQNDGILFGTDLDKAIADAQQADKLIFLDAYASWCGPCKRMEANVFTNAELGSYFNANFVNVKVDFDKNPELRKKYRVTAYPTLLFLNSDGSINKRYAGYRDAAELLKKGQKLID